MRLERLPALESVPRDGVALHVADAALVLALGPGAVGRAGPRPEPPVAGEGLEPIVEGHFPRRRIVQRHQRPGVVEQHLLGNATEVAKRRLDPVEPGRLPLVPERLHIGPPRVAERRHEQVDPHPLPADRHPRLAEVDLQLPPRWCLEPQRRPRLGREFPPVGLHRPLHGAQADLDPPLALEILAHDIGVAPVPVEPLLAATPRHRRACRRAAHQRTAASRPPYVAPHRRAAASELLRQPPRPPAQTMQPHHRRHFVRLQHDLPPRLQHPRRGPATGSTSRTAPFLSLQRGPVLTVVRGSVLPVAQHAWRARRSAGRAG